MARRERSNVQPGQRFQSNNVVWEIAKVRSFNEIPHVRIVKVGDPTENKLISVSALLEGYDFVPEN
jgi:hypothetical protein